MFSRRCFFKRNVSQVPQTTFVIAIIEILRSPSSQKESSDTWNIFDFLCYKRISLFDVNEPRRGGLDWIWCSGFRFLESRRWIMCNNSNKPKTEVLLKVQWRHLTHLSMFLSYRPLQLYRSNTWSVFHKLWLHKCAPVKMHFKTFTGANVFRLIGNSFWN